MNDVYFGYLIMQLPKFEKSEDLIKWDILFAKQKNINTFVRIIHPFDKEIPGITPEFLEQLNKASHCQITFEEVDGRMRRVQKFLSDIQVMSGMN